MAQMSISISKITDMCRICLSPKNLNSSIFMCSPNNNKTFAQTLMECTSIQILIDDGLPPLICDNCLESLEAFLDLCRQCINSDSILRHTENSHVKNSLQELKNDDTIIKTENDIDDWQEYGSGTGDLINDSYSPFVFITVKENTEKNLTDWYPKEEVSIPEGNVPLEQKPDNNVCLVDKCVENNTVKKVEEKINVIDNKRSNEISSGNKPKSGRRGCTVKFQCDKCEKRYSRRNEYKLHLRIHTGERPYKCSLCPKSFTRKLTLNIHSRTHSGERPFSCDRCSKSFTQKNHLLTHMTVHTGERRFLCEICSKTFSQKIRLISHAFTHTGEKSYECKTCGKKFMHKLALKRHEPIHSDLKPFKCETCDKAFSRREACKTHEQIHSSVKPHICQVCNRAFRKKNKLKAHLRTHSYENI